MTKGNIYDYIYKKEFINRMAENGHKTKCSCREYFDLLFQTFYELLEEGETKGGI